MSSSSIWTGSLAVAHKKVLGSKGKYFPPIFSLPIELLEIVFIHGARDHYENEDSLYFAVRPPTWVNVSYVCQHWRNVALNCMTLWTYHFNLSPRWTEELLRRSRHASLKISSGPLYFQAPRWLAILDNVLHHSERIQELRLDLPVAYIPAKLPLRAPRLETLEIKLRQPLESNLEITDVDTPVLRTVKLVDYSLPWHMFNLSRLNTLVMHSSYPTSPLNSAEFLVALGNMQNLSVLHLYRTLPDDFLTDGLSDKIDLPRLNLLTVSDSPQNVMSLLSCIEIPLNTHLGLRFQLAFDSAIEDYTSISAFLAHRFHIAQQSSPNPMFRSLTLFISDITILTWSTLERDGRRQPDLYEDLDTSHIPLQVTWDTYGDQNDVERSVQVLVHTCAALPVENVQTLYVHWDRFPCQFECWEELLGCLPGLRYLTFEGGEMQDLSVLSREGEDGVVPALEELELIGISFPSEERAAEWGGMSHASFLEMISTRESLWDGVSLIDCKFREQ